MATIFSPLALLCYRVLLLLSLPYLSALGLPYGELSDPFSLHSVTPPKETLVEVRACAFKIIEEGKDGYMGSMIGSFHCKKSLVLVGGMDPDDVSRLNKKRIAKFVRSLHCLALTQGDHRRRFELIGPYEDNAIKVFR